MKICLFTSSLNRGGAERVFVNLANHWVGLGHEVDFVVFSPEGALRVELDTRVDLVDLGESRNRLPTRIAFILAFSRYLKEAKPERVFATLTYVTITALWARKLARYRGCIVVRQANALSNQSHQALLVRTWNWVGYHVAYRWADVILVNSKNSESEVAEMLPNLKAKLRLIYNPVLVGASLPEKAQKSERVILSSGRFAKQKDFPTLLRAFKRVRDSCDARLIILGDGPERASIEAEIKHLGISEHVTLEGYVDGPEAYYQQADLFVLSSLWEGFPNVLVEALAAGVPVVATDSKGGSREIVEPILPDGIAPCGDHLRLAECIERSLRMVHNSNDLRRSVKERFDLPVIAEKYLDA